MARQPADEVVVDRSGNARPADQSAAVRMRSRAGTYALLPAPHDFLFLRRTGAGDGRACLLAGEVRGPGVLCDVLSFVAQCGWRGELVAFRDAEHRSVWVDQGHVVGARSNVVRERLGEVLYRHGVLTREDVARCSEATLGGRLRFGEAAVKLGLVTREQLFRLMGRQIEEIVYGALLADRGTYWLLDSFEDSELAALEKLPVATVLREGVRRMHEARFFRSRVPSERWVPSRAPGRAAPETDPLGVFAAADGERSVVDLCRELGEGDFEVTRAVYQLVQSGHLAMKAPRVAPADAVRIFNEAIALILRELDALGDGDEVRAALRAFRDSRADLARLLAGAGPADDGTLDAAAVASNVARVADARGEAERLAACLHEYASYALFVAKPALDRIEPTASRRGVSLEVAEVLGPIAPEEKPR